VAAYEEHQQRVRGLRASTLRSYTRLVREFVVAAFGEDPIDVEALTPPDVVGFALSMTERFSPHSMKLVRTALRSFLSYLLAAGLADPRLLAAVPRTAFWRHAALPRGLTDEQLAAVLAAPLPSTVCARRDRAIVASLAALGLRPGELAAVRLDDIDWPRGTLALVTRKTRRGAILPLPYPAARAIADYLREERPLTRSRHVFVHHTGAHRGGAVSAKVVSAAVSRALERAGVDAPIKSAYVFRHTLAGRMVRHGASIKHVADVLGHQCLDTTTLYAKVDLPSLRAVAGSWPEVTP
jgi:site-specific recombinase XerD